MNWRIYYGDIEGFYPMNLPLDFLNFNNNQKMLFAGRTPTFMELIYQKEDADLIKKIISERKEKAIYFFNSPERVFLTKIRRSILENKKNTCRFLVEL
jgi:hypothetical protein